VADKFLTIYVAQQLSATIVDQERTVQKEISNYKSCFSRKSSVLIVKRIFIYKMCEVSITGCDAATHNLIISIYCTRNAGNWTKCLRLSSVHVQLSLISSVKVHIRIDFLCA
jgi:hypothetical protein